jgi:group I intron endonuclease
MIVYGIKNKVTNKVVYIGQTVRPLSHRWTQHLRDSSNQEYPLYRAMRKYGKENFEVFTIETVESLEELNKREVELINQFNTLSPNGYNLMLGKGPGNHSEESKEKIRQAAIKNGLGKWERTEEDNLKNRERALKQHADPVRRIGFLKANGSREFSVFKAIKIQSRAPGRPSVYAKGELIGTWFCATDCAKELDLGKKGGAKISSCLNKNRKSHKGFIFESKEF